MSPQAWNIVGLVCVMAEVIMLFAFWYALPSAARRSDLSHAHTARYSRPKAREMV
jgi:hypothetical protein